MSRRTERVAELIRQEVGRIILSKLSDPRIGFVTVTRVEVSADLGVAKIFISVLGQPGSERASLRGLESAKRMMQMEIGDILQLRKNPELVFRLDPGVKQSIRMSGILHDLASERGEQTPEAQGEADQKPDEEDDESHDPEDSQGEEASEDDR